MLEIRTVAGNRVGTIERTPDGPLTSAGLGDALVASWRRRGVDDNGVYDLINGWSNGYVSAVEAEPTNRAGHQLFAKGGQHRDHHKKPDYTPADLGVTELHTTEVDPQDVNVDRQHYQRDLDPDEVDRFRQHPKRLAKRWGLLARRPDGSLWVVNGQHHTQAAVDEGIRQMRYRVFDSTGPAQEGKVYAAYQRWHDGWHTARPDEPRNQVAAEFNPDQPRDPDGKWSRVGAEIKKGVEALDAAPAKLTRAPNGHYGDYEGEALTGPAGMGTARALSEYEGPEYQTTNQFLRGGYRLTEEEKAGALPDFLEGVPERIAEIDKTMGVSRLTHDVEVHRAVKNGKATFGQEAWYGHVIDWNTPDMDEFDRGAERWESGDRPNLTGLRWQDKAYSSTTADPAVAPDFGKRWLHTNSPLDGEPIILRIHVPAGTGGVRLAEWGHAAEILLQRDLTFEVTADHGVDEQGFRRLDVEVVPHGES